MSRFILLLYIVVFATQAEGAEPEWKIDVREAKTIEATLKMKVTYPNLKAAEWVVFVPVAPELPSQSKVKTTLSPVGKIVKEKSHLGRELLMARYLAKTAEMKKEVDIKVTYGATLHSRFLKRLADDETPPKVAELTAVDRKRYLAEVGRFDYGSKVFQNWMTDQKLKRVKAENESEIDFARRTLKAIRDSCKYDYIAEQSRDASAVCKSLKSDCGGLSILFSSVMRANGIPARMLVGRWAKSADPNEKLNNAPYYQWHVKAEFFIKGVGWIPVDPALAVISDRSPEANRFFGRDMGDFLTFHDDAEFEIDTQLHGIEKLSIVQAPVWWMSGGSGDTKNERVIEDWIVR